MLTPWIKTFFGFLVCVKWPQILKGPRKIGKQGWSFAYTRRETGERALEKMPRNNWIKLEDSQWGFRPGRITKDQIFTLQKIFKKLWEHGLLKILSRPVAYPAQKFWGGQNSWFYASNSFFYEIPPFEAQNDYRYSKHLGDMARWPQGPN